MDPHIIVRDRVRVDPKRPESHPDWEAAVAAGERNASNLQFETEHDRREYEAAVKANPNNVWGLPAFYPPLKTRSAMNDIRNPFTDDERNFRERVRQAAIRDMELYCPYCRRLTVHSISPVQCFCKKCGSTSRFRSKLS